MENASKALIIAGAILLAILIIGLGMFIFNSASDTLDRTVSRMSEQERQTHNDKFQKFSGAQRSGTDVKTLVNELLQNYSTQFNNGDMGRSPGVEYKGGKTVTVKQGETISGPEFNDMLADIKLTRAYVVEVLMNAADGIVNQINITEK